MSYLIAHYDGYERILSQKACRGKGLATETIHLIIEFCQKKYGEKLGFKHESFDSVHKHHVFSLETQGAVESRKLFQKFEDLRGEFFDLLEDGVMKNRLRLETFPLPMKPTVLVSSSDVKEMREACEKKLSSKRAAARDNLANSISMRSQQVSHGVAALIPNSKTSDRLRKAEECGDSASERRFSQFLRRLGKRAANNDKKWDDETRRVGEALSKFAKMFCTITSTA
eukprot:jgi/Bigna1/85395/estExt_fgenesh1_pg.C_30426